MGSTSIRPRWQRIFWQTLTLVYKNLLIFYRAPISAIFRALVIPIAFTVVICVLKDLSPVTSQSQYQTGDTGAIARSPTLVADLNPAIRSTGSDRLVFVRNGMCY